MSADHTFLVTSRGQFSMARDIRHQLVQRVPEEKFVGS